MLLPFGQFQTILPLAAWLAPIFLLRFSRTQRAVIALPVLALVHYLAAVVSLRDGLIPGQTIAFYALGGALGVLPYIADTGLARRVPGWARTLIFPATAVALDWTFGLTSLGTLGSVAYSQFGFLSLTQLASITGIWGIVFLIMWLATVTNEVWERGFHWATLRSSVVQLAAVLLLAVLLGGARLAFFDPTVPTVRVAALAADRALWHGISTPVGLALASGDDEVRAAAPAQYGPVIGDAVAYLCLALLVILCAATLITSRFRRTPESEPTVALPM